MDDEAQIFSDAYMRDRLSALLHRAQHAAYLLANERFASLDLTFQQAMVITFIYHNKGCNQKAVEDHIETRSASVTVLLNTMVSKGLIQKNRSPVDGREIVLALTPKGQRSFTKCRDVFEEVFGIISQGIDSEEVELVKNFLKKVIENCRKASVGSAASQRISKRFKSARLR